ncbi:hypothetical protein K2173_001958 [Erythroxylum novogranatense]|uniref:Membrane-associated kinase regulator 4 n=1 Tax=Erythroxylum novogranatense TaxID=1862640 RepID=A0AAV8SP86_9ROSI|nr:hypothetical protein K2173_001958 [Erythroxylum novogranatense]
MATDQSSCMFAEDEYIDIEVSSSASSNFICYSIRSPPQSREFEFQMSSQSHDRETNASPADELFYKGKLLPLFLPSRLQMVQKLLQNPITTTFESKSQEPFIESYPLSFITSSIKPLCSSNTPLEFCNISTSESSRVSSELNLDDYCFEWSSEINSFIGDQPKKSWSKKLKQLTFRQKLKASSAYLKSMFRKSGCTDDSCSKPAHNAERGSDSKSKVCLSNCIKGAKRHPFGKIDNERYKKCSTLKKSIERDVIEDGFFINQRRSFSGAIQWHNTTNNKSSGSSSTSSSGSLSTASSFSFSSNGFQDLHFLRRSGSANSEIENPIEGAIAHCKKSQELFSPRKSASDSSEFAVCRDQELFIPK